MDIEKFLFTSLNLERISSNYLFLKFLNLPLFNTTKYFETFSGKQTTNSLVITLWTNTNPSACLQLLLSSTKLQFDY